MKNKFKIFLLLSFVTTLLISCSESDPIDEPTEPAASYIINFGDYSGAKSTITAYDKENMTVTNNYYEAVNGVSMVSNVSYAFNYDQKIFMLGNNPDELLWVDAETFEQSENSISADIVKPRYGVGFGNYLYISCWGGDIWADESLSYIAKFNLSTNTVEDKIELPGGPEGMAIAGTKLYAALNYNDSIAVIDLNTSGISYIETPAVSSYFVKDNSDNLYVSFVSTYSDYSETTGLGYINTTTNELETVYPLEGVTTSYVNVMAPNDDFSKIYVQTSAYDAQYNLSGAIAVFDVATKTFDAEYLVSDIAGANGVGWYNGKVFSFIAESVTANGSVKTYQPDGTAVEEFETGKAPFMLLTTE